MSVDPAEALPSRPSPAAAGARLGELYAAHARMVYGICRMLLRDANEAEDATQQVFLSAYRNLLTGTDVRDPSAWLGTIARNACRRRAAARMREPLAADEKPTRVAPAAEEDAIGREETAALYGQLAALPGKQREAVVLRDLYGLRYDEVAKALGTSRPAVEALLFRGRRQLQRRLRPGVAAGVLVVPLAVQESIAYAVPGFAAAATPVGAAAAAGIPLVAKLAAAGGAVAIAGSAGAVAERNLRDPPARPPEATTQRAAPPAAEVAAAPRLPALLPVPAGGFPAVARPDVGRSGSAAAGNPKRAAAADDEHGDEAERQDDESDGRERAAADRVETRAEAKTDADDRDVHGAGDAQPEAAADDAAAPPEDSRPDEIARAPETVDRAGEDAGDGGENGDGERT